MGMMATIHVQIDAKVKRRAEAALAAIGLSVPDAVCMMLISVSKEGALPFDPYMPNATTIKAMKEADAGKGKRFKPAEEAFRDLGI